MDRRVVRLALRLLREKGDPHAPKSPFTRAIPRLATFSTVLGMSISDSREREPPFSFAVLYYRASTYFFLTVRFSFFLRT